MKIRRIATFMLCLALLITMGGSSLSPFFMKAEAATNKYSNVLDDLKKDKDFNPDDYPSDSTKNHLEVIQIAEGENHELFVYVYQPGKYTKDYRAKYINMAREDRSNRNPDFNIYSLTYVNSNGVFDKYVVNNFVVSNETYRYYNIAAVYRAFDKDVDDKSEAVDGVNCKGFSVGLVWCAYNFNGDVVYECEKIEVVEIDILAFGRIRYDEGFLLRYEACDSHFVVFDIMNFDVEKIYDAKIRYYTQAQKYSYNIYGPEETILGERVLCEDWLNYKETGFHHGDGLLGKDYSWKRILTVDDFRKQLNETENFQLVEDVQNALNAGAFVFQFLETDYAINSHSNGYIENSTLIQEFGFLQLHFLSAGKTYNLGCVSDLVYSDSDPEATVGIEIPEDFFTTVLILLCLVVLACFFGPLFAALFRMILSFLSTGLSVLFQLILFIISLPFRLFKQKK